MEPGFAWNYQVEVLVYMFDLLSISQRYEIKSNLNLNLPYKYEIMAASKLKSVSKKEPLRCTEMFSDEITDAFSLGEPIKWTLLSLLSISIP